MGRIEKTVFISYRRTNFYTALAVYQDLTAHGYDVFFDYQSIDSGNFAKAILENIEARAHFVLVLSSSALERCSQPNDWLRREIETAIELKRNIVPLMMEGFDFGSPSTIQALSGNLSTLNTYNGLRLYSDYFFDAMEKLRTRFLNVAIEDLRSREVSAEIREANETKKTLADEAPQVEVEQITAEEWFERAYAFDENKNYDDAIRCYRKAIDLNPDYASAYNNLGNLLDNLNRTDEADAAYRKAIELNPDYADAYYNLGILLKDLKRYNEAEAAYRKAIELNPDYASAYNNLGSLLSDLKRYDEAETTYRKAIELNPDYASAYNNLGIPLNNLKRYDEAEAAYRKAIQLNPDLAETYYNLGTLLKTLERYDEAEAAYRKAIELKPDDATTYYKLGLLLYKNLKRPTEAEATYRKAIKINPDDATAYFNLGVLLQILERYDVAEVAYRKAIELKPDYDSAYYFLGNLLKDLKRYHEAEAAYRKAIELNPDYDDAYSNLGVLLDDLKRYDEAEATYRKAIELDPSNDRRYIGLIDLFRFENNKPQDALPLLAKRLELNPDNFNAHLAIASIDKQAGREVSKEYIEKARQFMPEDDWYNRTCLESVCDNFDVAFEHLQKASELEKFNPTWAWEDPDLQWIRDDPRFVQIVGPKPE